jgi:hypothetical protein
MDVPGGPGPWFCTLLFNTGKKKTHLIAHTLPHLALDALNREGGGWIIILKVGPFEHWTASVSFLALWTSHVNGRLERGLELYMSYRTVYNLQLWARSDVAVVEEEAVIVEPMYDEIASLCALFTMPTTTTVGSVKGTLEKFKCKAPKRIKRKK